MANDEILATIGHHSVPYGTLSGGAAVQAYLKSSMSSLGVRVPEVRRLARSAAANHPFDSTAELQATVLDLWRGAEFCEERHAPIDLTGLPIAAGGLRMLPVYGEIIRTGASWDLVDGLAHRIDVKNLPSDDGTGGDRLVGLTEQVLGFWIHEDQVQGEQQGDDGGRVPRQCERKPKILGLEVGEDLQLV